MEEEAEELFRLIKEVEQRTGCIVPLHNVIETEDEYVVTVDMPGVRKEDIDVRVHENQIAIEAPCRMEIPSRRLGNRYKLLVDLPKQVDPNMVKARYQLGVLEIRVSKKRQAGVRIPVE